MGWRREIRDRIAELEQQRLRLEEQRRRARRLGTAEGERLEGEIRAKLQEISHHIDDLWASLG
jgi:hypothetical protein